MWAVDAKDTNSFDPYASILRRYNIPPTHEGIDAYLRSLVLSESERRERDRQIERLILLLGNEDFRTREKATRDLIAIPDLTPGILDAASRASDPEVVSRVERIVRAIAHREQSRGSVHLAVLRTIQSQQIRGIAKSLLAALPVFEQPHILAAAQDALAATVDAADAPLLRDGIKHGNVNVRVATVIVLGRTLGDDASEELTDLLNDSDTEVRLAAAKVLADFGNRASLPVLGALLLDEDLAIRSDAASVLRALTGQQLGYIAYDDANERASAAERWIKWIAAHGESAELTFPIAARPIEIGHTLVLVFREHMAIELDASGKEVWRQEGLNFPWAIQPLPNGHRLIGSYRGKFIVEYDATGKEVWRKNDMPGGVFGVQRLDNGNTLAGCHTSKRAVEIDQDGNIVWDVTFDGQPMDVQRLANGNTLVALHIGRKVVEVDQAGTVVWQIDGLGIPRTARRLENGNTLISDEGTGRVDEFDRAGAKIWSYTELDHPYDAQRLSNGNTLITDALGVRIVNPEGAIVWKKEMAGVGRAIRF